MTRIIMFGTDIVKVGTKAGTTYPARPLHLRRWFRRIVEERTSAGRSPNAPARFCTVWIDGCLPNSGYA